MPLDVAEIRSLSVHPAIAIARVGNAPGEFLLASEVPGQPPAPDATFKDANGRVKRQAARFRIYAELRSGEVREVTADDAEIEWRVEVANLKAGWYQFNNAMDLDRNIVVESMRRNANVPVAQRPQLDIRPSAQTISGRDRSGCRYRFSNGKFFDRLVELGEVRTDRLGRLIFLGGRGVSRPKVAGQKPETFANNDGWHDDVCDGPVRATVTVGGQRLEAKAGYVVVAPPNYGPGLFGAVTMDDVVRNTFHELGWIAFPDRPSFSADIWPIFDRITQNQWVNSGIYALAGHGSRLDARNADVIARLADPGNTAAEFRARVLALFRAPGELKARPAALPPFYGDTFGDYDDLAGVGLTVTTAMYRMLGQWAAGNFDADWRGIPTVPAFDDLPPASQPEALDRAGLYECLGGPFHPGIELTWPMRFPPMWAEPYRLHLLPEGQPVRQDYGPTLTRAAALAADGPHAASGPGSLTRWLGVPWQTDEASCGSGGLYDPSLYLSSPSYWGARVPNQVLTSVAVELMGESELSPMQRDKYFTCRHFWTRHINGRSYLERIANMVAEWWEVGIVAPRAAPADAIAAGFPSELHVETNSSPRFVTDDPTVDLLRAIDGLNRPAPAAGLGLAEATPAAEPRMPLRRYRRDEV